MRLWQGPLLAPKDFEIGRVCIEAKAHRPGASPSVVINSEHQLDDTDLKGLVLVVRGPGSGRGGVERAVYGHRRRGARS